MTSKQGKRLNPFQHARLRPDTYIGSCKTVTREMIVYNVENEQKEKTPRDLDSDQESEVSLDFDKKDKRVFVLKKIRYNAGLTRLFIEIMSNAIDNKWKSEKHNVVMKKIDFTIENDPENDYYGWITIKNDGYWIPVEKKQYDYEDYRTGKVVKESLYPAEVFFGEMLAGTNFEEDESRKTSGRNGMGAKAVIVFSKQAMIEHTDPDSGKKFVQIYSDAGKTRSVPEITSFKNSIGYTSFSFLPDYEFFGYKELNDDLYALLKRYVYECAMITGLNITLNGQKIVVKDLLKFVRLSYPDVKENCAMHFKSPSGDECVLVERGIPDLDALDEIPHMSWINGINTRDGGVHVDAWRDVLFPSLVKAFNARKTKKGDEPLRTTAKELYPYFVLYVRCEANGAQFDSQTKDKMNSPDIILTTPKDKKEFTDLINEGIKKILKWNFVALLEEKLLAKADRLLSKKEGAVKKRINLGAKASDANYAGKDPSKCALYVVEGSSAKGWVDGLISQTEGGTDYNGSYAIRGKFINAQNASKKEIANNKEVTELKSMLGLCTGIIYSDKNIGDLRYGKVILMTDQDDDGFHIRGLILNFLFTMWPSLFSIRAEDGSPFVESLSTAVVISRKGASLEMFYSNPEFREWQSNQDKIKGTSIKYYKGLGSYKLEDATLFLDDRKMVKYILDGEEEYYMDLGFNKKQSNLRKEWIIKDIKLENQLNGLEPALVDELVEVEARPPLVVDGDVSLSGFVDKQLIIYHKMTLKRALPNMYDSFKEGQRKAFYGIMMDPDARKGSVNLENLVGAVKKATGYHHGAKSLEDTIKKMAQGFVGSNNIPLFINDGMFGTRMEGGDDAAASRYIATCLEDISWVLFSEMDIPLLERSTEDGKEVEYKMFMPILPMILINGAAGIASGFSTDIPCYNPLDLVDWIEQWLSIESLEELDLRKVTGKPLTPWYRGFTGPITLLEKGAKTGYAEYNQESEEPPVGWSSKGILNNEENGWWSIKELPVGLWTNRMKEYLEYLLTGTPMAGSKKKKTDRYIADLKHYCTPNSVHFQIKPNKDFIPDMEIVDNFKILQNTSKFTNMYVIDEYDYPRRYTRVEELLHDFCKKRLGFYLKRKDYWIAKWTKDYKKELNRYNFIILVLNKKINLHQDDGPLDETLESFKLQKIDDSFDYLLSMQMRSMTKKRLEAIKKEVAALKEKVDTLKTKTDKDLWREDLENFKVAYEKFNKTRKDDAPVKKRKTPVGKVKKVKG